MVHTPMCALRGCAWRDHFEKELHAFLERDHMALVKKINERGDFGDEIQRGLDEALKAFKATGTW